MTTDRQHRLFDFEREPLGLLPESMKSTIELNNPHAIATLHAPRRHQDAEPSEPTPIATPVKWLIEAICRLLR